VREARTVIKDAAVAVLSRMLDLIEVTDLRSNAPSVLDTALTALLDRQLDLLRDRMAATIAEVAPVLPSDAARLLAREHAPLARRDRLDAYQRSRPLRRRPNLSLAPAQVSRPAPGSAPN
jgi:hypothetical protein